MTDFLQQGPFLHRLGDKARCSPAQRDLAVFLSHPGRQYDHRGGLGLLPIPKRL